MQQEDTAVFGPQHHQAERRYDYPEKQYYQYRLKNGIQLQVKTHRDQDKVPGANEGTWPHWYRDVEPMFYDPLGQQYLQFKSEGNDYKVRYALSPENVVPHPEVGWTEFKAIPPSQTWTGLLQVGARYLKWDLHRSGQGFVARFKEDHDLNFHYKTLSSVNVFEKLKIPGFADLINHMVPAHQAQLAAYNAVPFPDEIKTLLIRKHSTVAPLQQQQIHQIQQIIVNPNPASLTNTLSVLNSILGESHQITEEELNYEVPYFARYLRLCEFVPQFVDGVDFSQLRELLRTNIQLAVSEQAQPGLMSEIAALINKGASYDEALAGRFNLIVPEFDTKLLPANLKHTAPAYPPTATLLDKDGIQYRIRLQTNGQVTVLKESKFNDTGLDCFEALDPPYTELTNKQLWHKNEGLWLQYHWSSNPSQLVRRTAHGSVTAFVFQNNAWQRIDNYNQPVNWETFAKWPSLAPAEARNINPSADDLDAIQRRYSISDLNAEVRKEEKHLDDKSRSLTLILSDIKAKTEDHMISEKERRTLKKFKATLEDALKQLKQKQQKLVDKQNSVLADQVAIDQLVQAEEHHELKSLSAQRGKVLANWIEGYDVLIDKTTKALSDINTALNTSKAALRVAAQQQGPGNIQVAMGAEQPAQVIGSHVALKEGSPTIIKAQSSEQFKVQDSVYTAQSTAKQETLVEMMTTAFKNTPEEAIPPVSITFNPASDKAALNKAIYLADMAILKLKAGGHSEQDALRLVLINGKPLKRGPSAWESKDIREKMQSVFKEPIDQESKLETAANYLRGPGMR